MIHELTVESKVSLFQHLKHVWKHTRLIEFVRRAGACYVACASLELAVYQRLALNSLCSYLSLPSTES